MAGDDVFDVLQIDVFATDNQQILFAADDVELVVQIGTEITGVVPAIDDRLRSEVGAVVVALEQTVAPPGATWLL